MGTPKASADCGPVTLNWYVKDNSSPRLVESWLIFVINMILIFLWVINQFWLKPSVAWVMLQKDNMSSMLTSNSVTCLVLHLMCAKTDNTLPWWACGTDGDLRGLALQKEQQMCCRTCVNQYLKHDFSCPGPVCNSLSLEHPLNPVLHYCYCWTKDNITDWYICYSRGLAPMMGLL